MAQEAPALMLVGCTAAADLSAKQFYAVKVTAAFAVNLAGIGEAAIGILQNKPISGEEAMVATAGLSKGVASGVITAGDKVQVDTGGKFKTFASGVVIGIALNTTSADGDLVSIQLTNKGISA